MGSKKQHYVPQFLLRNFCLTGEETKISVYRFAESRHLPRASIRDQAHENRFYGADEMEAEFAVLEGESAPIVARAVQSEVSSRPVKAVL